MLAKSTITDELLNPMAICERELPGAAPFTIQMFELCTICGARFGIGYHGACEKNELVTDETEELPRRLTEILAKDHRRGQAHKRFIELDM